MASDLSETGSGGTRQEELRESGVRYRTLFESNPLPMWVHDLQTLKFLAVNDAAVHLYGYAREELLSMTITDIIPAEALASRRQDAADVARASEVTGKTWQQRRKDGHSIDVEITSQPVVWEGKRAELVLAQDVTERKRLQEQLQQAQKMESVGQLAGGVAHDFNNLLTIITGYSEIVLANLGPDEPLREMVDQIRKAGDRAASLTRQLLAFSRKQVLVPVVLDLNELVLDMEKMLSRLIGEDIDFLVSPETKLWAVEADAAQLEQVIMNLVVNARDAMPQGGKLTIETANIALDETYRDNHPQVEPGKYVLLAVSDTGCGMDAATRSRIFEPFFTTKGPEKGTGLGLATVYGIVKQSGGHIDVYSEPGIGSSFKVYLPRSQAGLKGKSLPGLVRPLRGSETLLLVEDEAGVRALARLVLQSHGYTVLEAANGSEALQIAEQHRGAIHLMVSDVVMPSMSGRQLAERLQPLRPGMRILYLSGYTDDAIVRHGVLDPDTPFLQKPFSPLVLARKVREVLDQTNRVQ